MQDRSTVDNNTEDHYMATAPKGLKRNKQKPEPYSYDIRGNLEVTAIYETIQGEGPFAGRPAVFVRLSGCNLQCPHCDTDYTSIRTKLSPAVIAEKIKLCMPIKPQLVVLSGGEPFRQNITLLTKLLINSGITVPIETNGTIFLNDFPFDKTCIIVSPKTAEVHPHFRTNANGYKYILDADHVDEDGLPTSSLGMKQRPARPVSKSIPIWVQPMDSGNEKKTTENLEVAVRSCMTFGYRLSLQIHKIIGLP